MFIRRASRFSTTCQITVELPIEVADLLINHRKEVVAAVDALARELERRKETDARRVHLARLDDIDRRRNREKWSEVGRLVARELRHRKSEWRSDVLNQLSGRYGLQASFLSILAQQHEKRSRERLSRRRDTEIIRLYFRGKSNRAIAKALRRKGYRASPETVGRRLSAHDDLIFAIRRSHNFATTFRPPSASEARDQEPDTSSRPPIRGKLAGKQQ